MAVPEPEEGIRPGARVGAYEVMRRLSHGGMGTLYLGRRMGPAGFLRHVAIKAVHPHLAENERFVRMFLDEARLSSRIHHPNVVHVEDLGEVGGHYYLVMEYIHGAPLTNVLANLAAASRRLRPEVAVAIAIGIADGLHAAHELTDDDGNAMDIVHRDVSPHNVLLSASGQIKLIDFGVAKALDREHLSVTGSLKGKYAYMSPEQAECRTVDRRTDVYALGIVLWEMLTLRRLFAAHNDIQVLDKVRSPKVMPPSVHYAGVPETLDRVVMRALAPRAEQRYATARDFRLALLAAVPGTASVDATTLGTLVAATVTDELEEQRETLMSGVTSPSVAKSISSAANMKPKERMTLIQSFTVSAPGNFYAKPGQTADEQRRTDFLRAPETADMPPDSLVTAMPSPTSLPSLRAIDVDDSMELAAVRSGPNRMFPLLIGLGLLAVVAVGIGGYLGVQAALGDGGTTAGADEGPLVTNPREPVGAPVATHDPDPVAMPEPEPEPVEPEPSEPEPELVLEEGEDDPVPSPGDEVGQAEESEIGEDDGALETAGGRTGRRRTGRRRARRGTMGSMESMTAMGTDEVAPGIFDDVF